MFKNAHHFHNVAKLVKLLNSAKYSDTQKSGALDAFLSDIPEQISNYLCKRDPIYIIPENHSSYSYANNQSQFVKNNDHFLHWAPGSEPRVYYASLFAALACSFIRFPLDEEEDIEQDMLEQVCQQRGLISELQQQMIARTVEQVTAEVEQQADTVGTVELQYELRRTEVYQQLKRFLRSNLDAVQVTKFAKQNYSDSELQQLVIQAIHAHYSTVDSEDNLQLRRLLPYESLILPIMRPYYWHLADLMQQNGLEYNIQTSYTRAQFIEALKLLDRLHPSMYFHRHLRASRGTIESEKYKWLAISEKHNSQQVSYVDDWQRSSFELFNLALRLDTEAALLMLFCLLQKKVLPAEYIHHAIANTISTEGGPYRSLHQRDCYQQWQKHWYQNYSKHKWFSHSNSRNNVAFFVSAAVITAALSIWLAWMSPMMLAITCSAIMLTGLAVQWQLDKWQHILVNRQNAIQAPLLGDESFIPNTSRLLPPAISDRINYYDTLIVTERKQAKERYVKAEPIDERGTGWLLEHRENSSDSLASQGSRSSSVSLNRVDSVSAFEAFNR